VTTQQIAGAIGVALSGVIFFGLLHRADPSSYAGSFAVALGFNVVVFLVTALMVQVLREYEVGVWSCGVTSLGGGESCGCASGRSPSR